MAKSPVDLAKFRQDQLAIVTGRAKAAASPAAPAGAPATSKLPAGVTGKPPLPGPARIVSREQPGTLDPNSMTPEEISAIAAAGWTEEVPLPTNTAEIYRQILLEQEARAAEEAVNPVDPRTPRPKFAPQNIDQLSPDLQTKFRQRLAESASQLAAAAAAQAEEAKRQVSSVPGLAQARQVAAQVSKDDKPDDLLEVVQAGSPAAATPTPPAPPPPTPAAPASAQAAPQVSETGAVPQMTVCPHCLNNLNYVDVPEPSDNDKISFLHAMCGRKPWVKTYPLFGGNASVTFRTLTVREINAIYQEVYNQRQAGKITEEVDFYEKINLFRLYLSITNVRWHGADGFSNDLPDGLSPDTNEYAESFWTQEPMAASADTMQTPNDTLPTIEQFMQDKVLKTEAMLRVVNLANRDFNRMAARMEAVAQNSDFWKPTGQPS